MEKGVSVNVQQVQSLSGELVCGVCEELHLSVVDPGMADGFDVFPVLKRPSCSASEDARPDSRGIDASVPSPIRSTVSSASDHDG